jgi:hypothetical protein
MAHVLQDGGVDRTVPQASGKVHLGIDEQGEQEEQKHHFSSKKLEVPFPLTANFIQQARSTFSLNCKGQWNRSDASGAPKT